ncbi:uncharacterized protein N7511_011497 [Penicillium nucicola]|uniref:uncharacterized protein n=1 Tax=Penicillium nucicola TaxID=1850975 RepID=UPI002544D771|nr:uncharacterized protein N7511_011497 [Penicillium nucicola]KAJ5742478.1 hypothetical protein N7511_011497 [Penicillium nucicola]
MTKSKLNLPTESAWSVESKRGDTCWGKWSFLMGTLALYVASAGKHTNRDLVALPAETVSAALKHEGMLYILSPETSQPKAQRIAVVPFAKSPIE